MITSVGDLAPPQLVVESKLIKEKKYAAIKSSNQQGCDICILGDSLIEYWDIKELAGKKCFNAGVGDATTIDVVNHLTDGLLAGSFDTILIILGTNDVKYDIPPKETAMNISSIISFINNHLHSPKIIYCTIPPVNGRWDRNNKALTERNDVILENLPAGVLVHSFNYLKDERGNLKSEYTVDGLHFSESSYSIIKHRIESLIIYEKI